MATMAFGYPANPGHSMSAGQFVAAWFGAGDEVLLRDGGRLALQRRRVPVDGAHQASDLTHLCRHRRGGHDCAPRALGDRGALEHHVEPVAERRWLAQSFGVFHNGFHFGRSARPLTSPIRWPTAAGHRRPRCRPRSAPPCHRAPVLSREPSVALGVFDYLRADDLRGGLFAVRLAEVAVWRAVAAACVLV